MECSDPVLGKLAFNAGEIEDAKLREKVLHHREECVFCRTEWNVYRFALNKIDIDSDQSHPDSEQLFAYASRHADRNITEKEADQIKKHLTGCQQCSKFIARLKASDELLLRAESGAELPLPRGWTTERERLFTERLNTALNLKQKSADQTRNTFKDVPTVEITDKNDSAAAHAESEKSRRFWHLPSRGFAFIAAALLVFAAAGLWAVFNSGYFYSPPEVYRGATEIQLLKPEDGAAVGIYQEFAWQTSTSVQNFLFTVADAGTGITVLQIPLKQKSYLLNAADAAKLTNNTRYEWSVQNADDDNRSTTRVSRQFVFVSAAKPIAVYRDYSEDKRREAMLKTALEGEMPVLEKFVAQMDSYLKNPKTNASPADRAWAHYVQAIALYNSNKQDSAAAAVRAALQIWESEGLPDERLYPPNLYARALINYGLFSEDSGDLDVSLKSFHKALAVLEGKSDRDALLRKSACLLNLGALYRIIGFPQQAKDAYGKALEIDRQLEDDQSIADELTNIGNLLVDELEDPQQGLELLQEAARWHERFVTENAGKFADNAAATFDGLAVAYRQTGNPQLAVEYFNKAVAADTQSENADGLMATKTNLGTLLLEDLGDVQTARLQFQEAVNIAENENELDPDYVWRAYDGLGRVDLNAGDFNSAEKNFRRAIAATGFGSGLKEKQLRRVFRAKHTLPSYSLSLLYRRKGDGASYFDTIENARATSLHRSYNESVNNEETTRNSRFALADFQTTLQETEAALVYSFGSPNDRVLLFVVTRDDFEWYDLPVAKNLTGEIRQTVRNFKSGDGDAAQTDARNLSQILLPEQLLTRFSTRGIQRFLISPDSELNNLPFDALPVRIAESQSEPLIKKFKISLVPSFRWRDEMRKRGATNPTNQPADALIVADPIINPQTCRSDSLAGEIISSRTGSAGLPELPETRREAEIALTYASRDSQTLIREQAALTNFTGADLKKYKVLHLATHAFSGGNLETSTLLFGCRGEPDVLTGAQVLNLPLSGNLVVLSACETNVGNSLSNEGNDSLAWGFLVAGAGSVLATRWTVNDRAPVQLIEFFYQNLAQGDSVDEALHRAKLTYIEKVSSNPRDWAAFAATGFGDMSVNLSVNPRQSESFLSRQRNILLIVSALVIVALASLFFIRRKKPGKQGV